MTLSTTTEYDRILAIAKRFGPSIDIASSDINTVVDDMITYLTIVSTVTAYDEDTTSEDNFKHRRLVARLVVWELNQPTSTSSWDTARIAAMELSRGNSTLSNDRYWYAFVNELVNMGYSIELNSDWGMLLGADYDHDQYDTDRTLPSGF